MPTRESEQEEPKNTPSETFAQITEPLRKARKKINKDETVDLVHKMRNE